MIVILRDFRAQAIKKGFSTPVPPDGDVFTYLERLNIDLHITQEGDKNLIYGNVEAAVNAMLDEYGKITSDEVELMEVHVLDGFYLEGYVTLMKRGFGCGDVVGFGNEIIPLDA